MDFLEIRRKAKEREVRAGRPVGAPATTPPASLRDDEPLRDDELLRDDPAAVRLPVAAEDAPRVVRARGGIVDALREELSDPRYAPPPAPVGLVDAAGAALEAPPLQPWIPAPGTVWEGVPATPLEPAVAESPPLGGPGEDTETASRASDPLAEFFFDPAEVAPPLADLAPAPLAARPAAAPLEEPREWLAFRLGDEEYAIEIERVREVLKTPMVTEVPRAPAHVLGVIMVRGEVIAIFDPRHRLALPPARAPRVSRVLVCDAGDGPVGLLVDAVSDVVRLRAADVEPRPNGVGGVQADYIAGIGRAGDRMVVLLDLAAVLRGAAAQEARP
jgi:purine-binding chemotaxis protein CheW